MNNFLKQGDRLFEPQGGGWSAADLSGPTYLHYIIGYRLAAMRLIERLPDEPGMQGMFLAFPAIFLSRHYLELSLKYGISLAEQLGDAAVPPKKTHGLEALWARFCRGCGLDASDEAVAAAQQCIEEFAAWDPHSSRFRYPDAAEKSEAELGWLNMNAFAATMGKLSSLIEAVFCQLQVELESQAEMASWYKYEYE